MARKTSVKKSVCAGSNFIAFIPSRSICQTFNWRICLELDSKGLYQSLGKAKEGRCLVFTSSTKRRIIIRQFHVVVVQRRQGNVQNRMMQVQSCCFAY